MAHFWFLGAADSWAAFKLNGPAYQFVENSLQPAASSAQGGVAEPAGLMLQRRGSAGKERWLLLAPAGCRVCVNGDPMQLGVRQLRDRDEILLGGDEQAGGQENEPQRIYFSTERLAEVAQLPGGTKPVFCVRCKQLIEPGTLAVQCPAAGCGLWHHESEERRCWTYAPRCAMCPQPTALDTGFLWTPAAL